MNNTTTRRTPQQARSIEKKQRIIDAALDLFGEKGFQATTAKNVAVAAGVSVGTFYAYFTDKKALLMEILSLHMASIDQSVLVEMDKAIGSGMTGRQLVAHMVKKGHRSHNQKPGLLRTMLAMRYSDPDLAEFSRKQDDAMIAKLALFLHYLGDRLRVADKEAAARVLGNSFEETLHCVAIGEADIDNDRLYAELVDMASIYLFKDPDAPL